MYYGRMIDVVSWVKGSGIVECNAPFSSIYVGGKCAYRHSRKHQTPQKELSSRLIP